MLRGWPARSDSFYDGYGTDERAESDRSDVLRELGFCLSTLSVLLTWDLVVSPPTFMDLVAVDFMLEMRLYANSTYDKQLEPVLLVLWRVYFAASFNSITAVSNSNSSLTLTAVSLSSGSAFLFW